MNPNDLNLDKYQRIFAFGCSFTNYRWATWADIIAEEIKPRPVYNYGMAGGGNLYIAHAVSEADAVYNFTDKDLVMIMWTNVQREDRYYQGQWLPAGNIFSQDYYPIEWKYMYDLTHYLLRDLAMIKFTKNFLENKQVDHHFMSMVPIGNNVHGEEDDIEIHQKIIDKYDLSFIRTSIWEMIFDCDWHSIQPRSMTKVNNAKHHVQGDGWYEDNHAHPREYLAYLKKNWPDTNFKPSTETFVETAHKEILESTVYQKVLIERMPVKRIHQL